MTAGDVSYWDYRRLLRRPDEIYLLLIGSIALLPTLFGEPTQSIAEAIVWPPLRYAWAAVFVTMSATILLLSWRPREIITTILIIYRAQQILALSALTYSAVIFIAGVSRGWESGLRTNLPPALFVLGYAIVRWARCREISIWLETQKRRPRQ